MSMFRHQFLADLHGLLDLVLLGLSLYVAIFLQGALTPWPTLAGREFQVHSIVTFVVLFFLWRTSFFVMGLYQARLKQSLETVELLKASALATCLLALIAFTFPVPAITPVVLLRFLLLSTLVLIGSHSVMRHALKAIRLYVHSFRQLLIVGTNNRAVAFANNILARPELGYKIVGFVDDAWVGPPPIPGLPARLVCDLDGFRRYVRNQVIDEVVIALPVKSFYRKEDDILQICREHGLVVHFLANLFDTSLTSPEIGELGSSPVVSFHTAPVNTLQLVLKRLVDILGSIFLILLLSPIMLAAFMLVKLESEGPAIFTQERVGLNKRRFRVYKFRSMVVNAEKLLAQLESRNEAQGPVFKIKRDPRITRVGGVIRKTSIDELPQLFNVLKGDMSLVGPRPLQMRDFNGFSEDWQRRRFSVRPGITCLWQVSGRSGIHFDQWMRLDLEYIDRWSLWLDLKILVRTIPAVVRGSGAA